MSFSDPRQLAFAILCRVEEGAFADLTLDTALSRDTSMDPRDRSLVTELVYGVLRQRGRLDFALSRFCAKPLSKVETRVLVLLRLGAYQVLLLDRVPDSAAVNETVKLAHREGLARASGFINGILRSLVRGRHEIAWPDRDASLLEYLEHVLSLPKWLARGWFESMGKKPALALAEALCEVPPFTLRVNTLKISRKDYLDRLRAAGHQAAPTLYAPEGITLVGRGGGPLPGGGEGWYQVQDEASMLIAHLLAPGKGDKILDACAAPGGKTTHIAALAHGGASVMALDLHPQRVRLVAEGAERLGCGQIETRPWDLTRPPDFLPRDSFDKVLVDAPCSGLGVLRRNPEIRWRRTKDDIRRMAALQKTILGNVAPLVRPGGVLLYSLCTMTPEETTGVVEAFLGEHGDFEAEDLRLLFPDWKDLFDSRGALRTFPHLHGGMDAFFAVRLRRRSA